MVVRGVSAILNLVLYNFNPSHKILTLEMFNKINNSVGSVCKPFKDLNVEEGLIDSYFPSDTISYEEEYTLEDGDSWFLCMIDSDSIEVDDKTFYNGDLIYYFDGWNKFDDISDQPESFEFKKKYLAALTSRFVPSDIQSNYPDFVKFIKGFLEQCDKGWYKIASGVMSYGNIDEMPDDVLPLALSQYAISFSNEINKIDYFYDKNTETYNYNNIRQFLRIVKKFLVSKGTPQSLLFLYEMLTGKDKCEIILPYKRLMRLSDVECSGMENGEPIYTSTSRLSGHDDDLVYTYDLKDKDGNVIKSKIYDNLYHIHGEDSDDRDDFGNNTKYAYYTVMMRHTLDNPSEYKELVDSLGKPSGTAMYWKRFEEDNFGLVHSLSSHTISITNYEEDFSIFPFSLFGDVSADCEFGNECKVAIKQLKKYVQSDSDDEVLEIIDKDRFLAEFCNDFDEAQKQCISDMFDLNKNTNKIGVGVDLTTDELKQIFTLKPDEELVIEYKYSGMVEKNVNIYVDYVDINENNNNEDNPFKYNFYGSYELVRSELEDDTN